MRVDDNDFNTDMLRQQQKVAAKANRNIRTLRSGQPLTDFEKLQLKAAFFKQKETGFLPKLDARLAVALTALNDNVQAQKISNKDAAKTYDRTHQLQG